jgi:hypothetical protein
MPSLGGLKLMPLIADLYNSKRVHVRLVYCLSGVTFLLAGHAVEIASARKVMRCKNTLEVDWLSGSVQTSCCVKFKALIAWHWYGVVHFATKGRQDEVVWESSLSFSGERPQPQC